MKLKRFLTVGGVFLIVLLVAANAFGQNPNPRLTISVGVSRVSGDEAFVASGDSFTSGFADGGKARVRLTLDLTSHFSIEGSYSYGRNNLTITEQSGGTLERRDFGIVVGQGNLNFLHFFTSRKSRVRPFLTYGIGAVNFSPTDEAQAMALANDFITDPTAIDSTFKFGFNVGVGIEGRFSRWAGIRFDVKDYISAYPRFGLPETSTGTGGSFFPATGIVHNLEASVGIVFFFLP